MDIHSISTQTSTNLESAIKKAQTNLDAARQAGARNETIQALKEALQSLQIQSENEATYKDIRFLKEWPNDILITRYEEATAFARNLEPEVASVDLFNQQERETQVKKYNDVLKLIELLEDEGRERQMIYFMSDNELLATCKDIFGQECEWVSPTTVANKGGQKS